MQVVPCALLKTNPKSPLLITSPHEAPLRSRCFGRAGSGPVPQVPQVWFSMYGCLFIF